MIKWLKPIKFINLKWEIIIIKTEKIKKKKIECVNCRNSNKKYLKKQTVWTICLKCWYKI